MAGPFAPVEVVETLGDGEFFCTVCAARRRYHLRSRRAFRRVLFRKVGSGREVTRFIECDACWASYEEDAAHHSTEATPSLAVFQHVVLDALVTMAHADGSFDESERRILERIMSELHIPATSLATRLQRLAADADGHRSIVLRSIAAHRPRLNDEGRSLVLAAAYHVARADGRFDERERNFLHNVAKELGIGRGEAHIIFDLAEDPSELLERMIRYARRGLDRAAERDALALRA